MAAISGVSSDPIIDNFEQDPTQLPPDLEALAKKHYSDCNVRAYIVKIGIAQEDLRDGRINAKSQELRQQRANLQTITTFLGKVEEMKSNPNAKELQLAGEHQLMDKLYEIFPDQRLKKDKLTRSEAEMLYHAFTRHCDQEIHPNMQELTSDITHIIEDSDKIFPILKELLKAYDDLINRMNNKPK